ncbi:uncharacterized protein cubi_00974 [Cryptosporidium ubiquitum]|uniref:Secreted protein n=1 Tax=Cryptosporidium ubiquitum TaxID=857276 RepID=A0A1J4MD91_9CRYT|nr:uncharacterized protein cubi_00974 [Cryptosporidium ubiquitum]OII70829.1 hypothetical protein cubi_00974 [Cryptosporidium ubiquitum]
MRCKYVIFVLILLFVIVNAFMLQKREGVDLGLKKSLIQNAKASKFECNVAMECINIFRYYYFFVAMVYEIVSTSNCMSRNSDNEFRMLLSQKLSELNYYRNYFAEYAMNKGENAALFVVIHEFPKRKESFLDVCSQIKYIDAKELYSIELRVISNYLAALLELKNYIHTDTNILSDSFLLLNQKREVIRIINKAIEIISFTQKEIQNIKESSFQPKSIYELSSIPQKLQIIKIYRHYLKVRISHVVKLRQYIKSDKSKLFIMLEELENSNNMPPRY